MLLKTQSAWVSQGCKKMPLRRLLVVPFVVQIFAAVGLTGYLSFRNSQKAINDLASQLRREIAARIDRHLHAYLTTPHPIDRINVEAYRQGDLNLDDPERLARHFWRQGLRSNQISTIGVATAEGHLVGANGRQNYIAMANSSTGGALQRYGVDKQGQPTNLILEVPNYDPRQRSWYKTAVAAGQPTWTAIDVSASAKRLDLSAVHPFYDLTGKLQGVFFVDVSLSQIGHFLQGLDISPGGHAFILEPNGDLVASSTLDPPFRLDNQSLTRINVLDSQDTEIGAIARQIEQKFGQLSQLKTAQQLTFTWKGEPQFVQVAPFQDRFGLRWSIVVVIPQKDVMGQIDANRRATIALCLVALGLAMILGIFTARWIARPIGQLSQASRAIAQGDLKPTVDVKGIDELELLADAFNHMTRQLRASFQELAAHSRTLEEKVQQRTQELQQEIQERQLLEEKLLTSEETLRAIFEAMTDIVLVLDADANQVNIVPTNLGRLYEPDTDAVNQTVEKFFSDDRSDWLDKIRQALETQQTVNFDYSLPIGLERQWYAASISPMSNNSVIWVARNISDRKRVEAAMQQAKEAAEIASRAKSTFLANMSHELRSPLNAILGFAQLMARDRALLPDQQENLGIITRSAEHLLALINNVLSLSKIEAGRTTLNPQNFDLYRLLDDLEDMFRLKAEDKQLQLIFERTRDVPQYVRTDEMKLRQVSINLLNNAIKFTETGHVWVRVKRMSNEELGLKKSTNAEGIAINSQFPPHHARLIFEVTDTGPGIAPEELDLLFEPFLQTQLGQQAQEGTGLGLPISRQFVHLMGGNISVISRGKVFAPAGSQTSRPPKELAALSSEETTFRFDIDIDIVEATQIQTQQPARRIIGLEPKQPHYRIAIVDDKWSNRQLLVRLLRPLGFDVQEATNGQEAVELWERWDPNLIWMDMRMPVMDGYEATKRIKATTKGNATAIIALTASTLEEERAVILSAGCDDFVRKPFRAAEIFETMSQHIGVRYVYDDKLAAAPTTSSLRVDLDPWDLSALPPGSIAQLEQATAACDMDVVNRAIEELRCNHKSVADGLLAMANEFAYDEIWALIQAAKGHSEHGEP